MRNFWKSGIASSLLLLSAAIGASSLFAGCSEKCDPGYHLDHGLCYQDPIASAGAAGAAGAPSCDDPSITTFAGVCYSNDDCVCDSNFCAGYPGQAGVCTRTGCDTDPSVCPDGYSCMDLSAFGPNLPNICVK